MRNYLILVIVCALIAAATTPFVLAQDMVTVPDLTGLNVPQAGAALNRVGLVLGAENNVLRSADDMSSPGQISGQSIAAGNAVEPGTVVDITIPRVPNAILLYDDNDLTLVNLSGANININNITFNAVDGNGSSFAASRWAGNIRANQCLQLWSIGRNGPKGLPECGLIQRWIVSTNTNEHFWTGQGGTTAFNVVQGTEERAVCQVNNPGRCEFFLTTNARTGAATPYVYFAYTPDRLAIINTSEDRWMPIGQLVVRNNFARPLGAAVNVGNPDIFGNPNVAGQINRLAPGQCLLFTNSNPTSSDPPQDCHVIARLDIGPDLIFWGAVFPVESITDDGDRSCPAATQDSLTLCILPR